MTDGVTGASTGSSYSWFGVNEEAQRKAEQAKRTQQMLEIQLGMKKAEETDLDSSISQTTTEKTMSDSKKALLQSELQNIINTQNPLNKLYSGIKQFKIDGMCGMDMGMGQADAAIDMQLTGQELLDISSMLASNKDGQYSTADLANQLKEKGYNAEAGTVHDDINNADRDGITIKREDGTEIKLCDANGDGQLNGCDYDFSEALNKLNADLTEYQATLDAKQAEIDDQQEISDELQHELDDDKTKKAGVSSEVDNLNTQVGYWNHYIAELDLATHVHDTGSEENGDYRMGAKTAFNGIVAGLQKDYKSMTMAERRYELDQVRTKLGFAKDRLGDEDPQFFTDAYATLEALESSILTDNASSTTASTTAPSAPSASGKNTSTSASTPKAPTTSSSSSSSSSNTATSTPTAPTGISTPKTPTPTKVLEPDIDK